VTAQEGVRGDVCFQIADRFLTDIHETGKWLDTNEIFATQEQGQTVFRTALLDREASAEENLRRPESEKPEDESIGRDPEEQQRQ
jgi:hypothetical protein